MVKRNEIVEVFRERLVEVMHRLGVNRTDFARRVGVDRSTLAQLLAADNVRLPRSETLVGIADAAQVSVDWLLGLSQEGQLRTDVYDQTFEIEAGAGEAEDPRLQGWLREASGYKIRYVPATLPDLLRSEAVNRYQYQADTSIDPDEQIEVSEARLRYGRQPETDMEICSSRQDLESFVFGRGIWQGLSVDERSKQTELFIQLLDELYPTVRWFLYDGLSHYSVPLTIFGPLRAAIYVGDMYFVFNSTTHIRELTAHFDRLIRAAVVQPTEVIDLLEGWLRKLRETG